METVLEHIIKHHPSAKHLRDYFKKKGVYIDTREEWLLKTLKLAYLKSSNPEYKDASFKARDISVGSFVYCQDEEYQVGRVVRIFSDGFMCTVKFEDKKLPIMCDLKSMITIHNDKKRKLKLIY